ncbi:putative conserved hypothetical protein [Diplodia seriata]|uniref:Carboxymethylenebutenolidase n=1 Tax=Diplodia seriata TaxID=420778 RepID=A0A0G2H4I3_9PEZI|nr:putative conserved hypothetical protein [Diplodia seriata]
MVRSYVPLPPPAYKTLNAATNPRIAAIINYSATPVPATATFIPTLWHAPDQTPAPIFDTTTTTTHVYPTAPPNFTLPAHPSYRSAPAALAHTRSLAFIKPLLGGPSFDLEAIWNEHCLYEFGERAVDKTMATMVQEPYVNHIPTVTGGVGRERLTQFYRNHFVHSNPPDTSLELYLPFPYLVDGKGPAPGKKFEYRVPVAGVETARKLVDENAVQSNEMFSYGIREVDA